MPVQSSLTHCPHCGKSLRNMFQQTTPIEVIDTASASIFAEAINFAARFGVLSGGSLLTVWLLDWPVYWAAPVVGLGGAVALVVMEIRNRPPVESPKPQKTRLEINVTERPGQGRRRTVIDAFQGCRVEQLTKFADGYLNKSVPPSRRQMKQAGVSEGQSDKIKAVLIANGWAVSGGDWDTAPVVINWKGRAILREVLRQVRG